MNGSNTEVRTIKVEGLYEHLIKGRIILPRFQRTEVWDVGKKRDLIKSIRRRLPIGSLLVYEAEHGQQILVDGLQRTIAIRDYMHSPHDFIKAESLRGDATTNLFEALATLVQEGGGQLEESRFLSCVDRWIQRAGSLETDALTADSFVELSIEEFELGDPDAETQKAIRQLVYPLVKHIQEDAKIDDYPLALVEFQGSVALLPDIFRNINSGGVPLDDFDEFAIDWIAFHADIESQDIAEHVKGKWSAAEAKGLVVERWSNGEPEDGYTFWEYLFGLGQLLRDDYPLLFGARPPGSTATERTSFYLAALAHGLMPRVGEIRQLPLRLSEFQNGAKTLNLSKFEAALRTSCSQLDAWLRPSAGMKLNSSMAAEARFDSLSQLSMFLVLSMVARTLVGRYVPYSWEERDGWKDDWAKLEEELPRHLLYEVLQGSWSGSGDSNALTATWEGEPPIKSSSPLPPGFDPLADLTPSDLYTQHRSADEWRQQLGVWLRSETNGAQRVNRSVSKEAKLVMRYLYSDIPYDWYTKYTFAIDHQLPVSRIAAIIERDHQPGWPISAVGNLALLPTEINSAKSAMTTVQYLDSLDEPQRHIEEPILRYAACDGFDLELLEIPIKDGKDRMNREEFVTLIESRQNVIREKVVHSLGL